MERKMENKKKIRLMYKKRKRKTKESQISKKGIRREEQVKVPMKRKEV
jgi:hypothetical protein